MTAEVADATQRWAPRVTVATVVVDAGLVLLVEERIGGKQVLNQPAGHLEPGESLAAAALRETLEETAWDVELDAFIGCYQWTAADGTAFLRFCYAAHPLRHHAGQALDSGIERAIWMAPEQLLAQSDRLRSPLVWQVVADYLGGQRHPLSLVKEVA